MKSEEELYQNSEGSMTVFDKIIQYLEKKYYLRYNEIALEFGRYFRDANRETEGY